MKNRGLLLDRDGVINIHYGYVWSIDRFDFKQGLFPFLRLAQDKGYRLAIVTNQAGVARGYYTKEDFEILTDYMDKSLKREGINLDLVLSCFEHPDAVTDKFKRMSFWRKPNSGMILEAALRLNLDLSRSIMIGDMVSDIQAGLMAGVGKMLWLEGHVQEEGFQNVSDFIQAEKFL